METKIEKFHIHACSNCDCEKKLPWESVEKAWCMKCNDTTPHRHVHTHVEGMDMAARVEQFRVAFTGVAKSEPNPDISERQIAEKLRRVGFPARQIQNVHSMTGEGLAAAEGISKALSSRRKDAHFVLFGTNGTGKTQIATKVAHGRVVAGLYPGRYVCAPELLAGMQDCISHEKSKEDYLKPFLSTKFLVVDEAQDCGSAGRAEEWVKDTFRRICDQRYRECLPMLWLMNAKTEDEAAKFLGARITDRVRETGGFIPTAWKSYR